MENSNKSLEEWTWTSLGKVYTFQYGKGLPKEKRVKNGYYPVYGSNGVVGQHNQTLVNQPCIIVGRKGSAGAIHLANKPCWPIDTTYFVIPPDNVDLKFTYYLFSHLQLSELDRSTAIPGLNREDAYKQRIPLPPLPDQQRIVAKIEELFTQLDAAETALKRAKTNLKRYRQSVLQAAVTGELTRAWREAHAGEIEPAAALLERIRAERKAKWAAELRARGKDPAKEKYVEPQGPDTMDLPELADGWMWINTDQIGDIETGSTPLRSKAKYYDKGTIPWITSGAVNEPFIDYSNEFITELAIRETNAKIFPAGTLLIAMYGEGKTRGKISELKIDAATNQAIAAIILCEIALNLRDYVKIFYLYNYENIRLRSSGGVQPNLNLSIIKKTPIPFPPINEQREIIKIMDEYLQSLCKIDQIISKQMIRIKRLRQSILQRAFSGRLVC